MRAQPARRVGRGVSRSERCCAHAWGAPAGERARSGRPTQQPPAARMEAMPPTYSAATGALSMMRHTREGMRYMCLDTPRRQLSSHSNCGGVATHWGIPASPPPACLLGVGTGKVSHAESGDFTHGFTEALDPACLSKRVRAQPLGPEWRRRSHGSRRSAALHQIVTTLGQV